MQSRKEEFAASPWWRTTSSTRRWAGGTSPPPSCRCSTMSGRPTRSSSLRWDKLPSEQITSHISGFSQQQQKRLHRVPGEQRVLLIWKNILKTNKVEAITILETEKSYVNILLGDYDVPEVQILSLERYFSLWQLWQMNCFKDFLRKFSRYNFAQYCLGLLFTNRLFKVLTLTRFSIIIL